MGSFLSKRKGGKGGHNKKAPKAGEVSDHDRAVLDLKAARDSLKRYQTKVSEGVAILRRPHLQQQSLTASWTYHLLSGVCLMQLKTESAKLQEQAKALVGAGKKVRRE